jgi:hypothetical protein
MEKHKHMDKQHVMPVVGVGLMVAGVAAAAAIIMKKRHEHPESAKELVADVKKTIDPR